MAGETTDAIFSDVKDTGSPVQGLEELYQQALDLVHTTGRISIVQLQLKLGIGYIRAQRLMEMMEERGVFGPEMRSQWVKATGFSVR